MTIGTTSRMIEIIQESLVANKYVDVIDRMRPDTTLSINPSHDKMVDVFIERKNDFMFLLREAIFNIRAQKDGNIDMVRMAFFNIKINLIGDLLMNMHDINTQQENTSVTFECQVLATDAPRSYIKSAVFECKICNREFEAKCDLDRVILTPLCDNISCKHAKTFIKTDRMVTEDVQTILMQQPMESSKNSSPVIFTGKLVGNLVRTSYTGQKKLITGLFRSNIDLKNKEHDVFIDVMSVADLDDTTPILPDEHEKSQLKDDARHEGWMDSITNSFAPHIFGHNDVKLSLLLQLVGGVKTKKRGDINLFLIGDPSMAKSEFLKYAVSLNQKSIYTSGRGTSAAGLTIGIVKMSDGRSIAQAGVLPMCDKGLAGIDEFDKMGDGDRSAMHEAMEQQTVSIAKAGIAMTLPSRTSVLAAANPKFGMYDTSSSIKDNINVPVPLLTRFDMIWLIRDVINQTSDGLKANHVLDSFNEDMGKDAYVNKEGLIKLINFAKTFSPKLTEDSKDEFKKIYEEMRRLSARSEMPVSVRQLEAMVRLSMAYAKLHFRNEVLRSDVRAIKKLFEKMYEAFGESLSSGGTQSKIFQDRKTANEHDVINVWNGVKNIEGKVKLSDFQKALEDNGMTAEKAKALIARWENNNAIKLNSDNTYTRI
jgi:replicative DNA helicase Mcm